jgi:hypothetical protein
MREEHKAALAEAREQRLAVRRYLEALEAKGALADGRELGLAVRRYIEALETNRPHLGRHAEAMRRRLASIGTEIPSADPIKRLDLIQERRDLQAALAAAGAGSDLPGLDERIVAATEVGSDVNGLHAGFVVAAGAYAERKGIRYSAWRELGVPSAMLARAGITRSS